jgi:hypothetical protein
MSVFDGSVKTGRRVKDPGTDKTLSSPGALSWGGITGATALAGTTGVDAKLVTGDRWQQISGTQTENIATDLKTTVTGNQTHTVQGNQTISVSQDHKETVGGICNQTVVGAQIMTNYDVRTETRMITHTQTHGDLNWVQDPDGQMHIGNTNMGIWNFLFEFEVMHLEFADVHLEFKGAHPYFSGVDTNVSAFRLQNTELNAKVEVANVELKMFQAVVGALASRLRALEGDAVPAKLNGGVRVGVDSPFGG